MKLNKKKVFTLALALCLIATISLGSLAWFTDTDSVTNDFFIAGSEDQDPDDIFSVDVWEIGPDGTKDDDGITYPNILPGDELAKDVNIENTGSYAQYIRATVTVSDASIWQEVLGEHFVALDKIVNGLNGDFTLWSIVCDEVNDTLTYVLYYENTLAPDGIVNLFKEVAIPEELTREQAAKFDGGFVLNVVADAVQTENVGANAVEAFATVRMDVPEGNYCIMKNTTLNTNNNDWVRRDTLIQNVTFNSTETGLQIAYGNTVVENVTVNAGNNGNYAVINHKDSVVVYDETTVNAAGGGIGVVYGAQVEFNSGKVVLDSTVQGQRYNFYVAGEGSKVVINGGEFSFEAYRQRSYVAAVGGAYVEINGGTFGVAPNHPRWTYPIFTGQDTPETTDDGTVVIKGGTFGFDPSAWVATGYVAVESNGVWTVSAAE